MQIQNYSDMKLKLFLVLFLKGFLKGHEYAIRMIKVLKSYNRLRKEATI